MSARPAWGRAHSVQERTARPLSRDEAVASIAGREGQRVLARGLGRSYGDVALNDGGLVLDMTGMDRLLAFDPATGVLECEAGVSLDALMQWLATQSSPEGHWLPPVMPGTRFVTVGGAIANDVHGKNHHAWGTFGEHVLSIVLARSDGSVVQLGPADDLFRATVGGMGLTGLVLGATLQLRRVPSLWLETEHLAMANLDAFFALSDESSDSWEYTVGWFDSLKASGRGIFTRARHAATERPPPPLGLPRLRVPFVPRISAVQPLTARVFNMLYAGRFLGQSPVRRTLPIYGALFPLDAVLDWNRLYGAAGFYQYQCVVPKAAAREASAALLQRIAASNAGSSLTVIKTFADRPPAGLMSFACEGTTLALDFPNHGPGTLSLLDTLDDVVADVAGRVYPAKDGRVGADRFRAGYPEVDRFAAFIDPAFSSGFARRVGLA
ncbi:MAG TPA: FAD-binding oxidoreductase [Reyranellaceae bacterium]|nr:FAD-binding oxidoreductase [Reyranellaceae bacterium]